ncbi:MAG: cation diffusion facilitator family transporter [Cyanobacteria bacterium J06650_10]
MKGSGYQRQISYRLLLMMLWLALVVFAIELTAGWASHSLCLLAEALHTLVDVFSTLLSVIAIASPQRTLGKEIWGHGRAEAAGALTLSALMGFAGISILLKAFDQASAFFQVPQGAFPVSMTLPLIFLVGIGMIVTTSAAWFLTEQSKQNSSLALKLNAEHILGNSWLSGILLVGLFAIARGQRWLDPLLASIWVLLAVKSLWNMLQTQLPMLLKPTAIAPEAINQLVCQTEGVTRCTRILSRGMVGRQVWVELHIALHPEYMVIANSIGENVERSLRDHYGPVRTKIWLDSTRPKASPIPS